MQNGHLDAEELERISESRNEPEWLLRFRKDAFKEYEKLPLESSKLFKKYAALEGIDWKALKLSGKRASISNEFENGAIIENILDAVNNHPELVKRYFSHERTNKFEALSDAFFSDGLFINIPEGVVIEKNIKLNNNFSTGLHALKNLIIVGKNSSAAIAEENVTNHDAETVICSRADFIVEENAKFNYGSMQVLNDESTLLNSRNVELNGNAAVIIANGFFGSKQTISNIGNTLKGNASSMEDVELVFGNDKGKFNITSNLRLEGEKSRGKVAAKGIFMDESRGLFKGLLKIGKDAKGANAYFAAHSMLLSRAAAADAIPSLQIETNDVKATHSASVSQINEEQLFYLMSRGFDEKSAKVMLMRGFFEPLLNQIPIIETEGKIRETLDEKWKSLSERGIIGEKIIAKRRGDLFEGHYKYR